MERLELRTKRSGLEPKSFGLKQGFLNSMNALRFNILYTTTENVYSLERQKSGCIFFKFFYKVATCSTSFKPHSYHTIRPLLVLFLRLFYTLGVFTCGLYYTFCPNHNE